MDNDLILKVDNLEVSFEINDTYYKAIRGVSFGFSKGKIHAIVGESGSGKTVSMMSILGLFSKNARVDNGKIIFENQDILKLNEKELRKIRGSKIALIPQDPMTSLNPLYTIQNQLLETIFAHNNNISKNDAINLIKETLKKVKIHDIERVLKSYPLELSGGMKQRIIIAMALVLEAEIIIADEPTTALDVTIQKQILNILNEIKKSGKTIILITHNLQIVSNYADDVSVMYLGRRVEYNKTKELFINPKHPYTKALLGTLPVSREKKLTNLKGQIPSIVDCISGCSFHPRCEANMKICKIKNPNITCFDDKSEVFCHLFDINY